MFRRAANLFFSKYNHELNVLRASEKFNTEWYLNRYPDVKQAGLDPIEHYLKYGAKEGRDPGPEFCTRAYQERYHDVGDDGVNPLVHYLGIGIHEGRNPAPFTTKKSIEEPASIISKTNLFNTDWYRNQYKLELSEDNDAIIDYLESGCNAGRDPSPGFKTSFYLKKYPDVDKAGLNPLVHYILYGHDEGRLTKPGRALTLERLLWSGFSRKSLEELERLKCNPNVEEPEKISATWSLMVWYCTQRDYATALDNFTFACRLRDKLMTNKKWTTPAALCKVKLGQHNSARDLLCGSLKNGGFNPDSCLGMSNTACAESLPTEFSNSDSFRLHWINRVFEKQDLAPIKIRNHHRGLALDNLSSPVQPRSTGRGNGKISVVLPAYKAAATITLAIESVINQTWEDIELIVVDDCSDDDTFDIVQQFAAQDSRVTAVRHPQNMGAYAARNTGVRLCTGDFITVHDCDDWSHPQKLEIQTAPLIDDSRLLGTFSFWVKVDREMNILGGWRPWGNLIEINESSFLFRRSLLDSLGEWDNVRVAGDREFIWRAETKCGKESFAKVCENAPLSFSLASPTSLTQAPNTHVKTVYYGLRRTYREAARWWHAKDRGNLYLRYNEQRQRRPFPVPDAILATSSSKPVSHVLVADFSRQALQDDSGPADILEAVSQTGQTALFHWPSFFLDGDDTLDDCVFNAAVNNDIRLLVPGETIYAENVVILKTKPLGWLPDSYPDVRSRSVFSLGGGEEKDEPDVAIIDDIQNNIESVFGHSPVYVSFAEFQNLIFNG